MKMKTALVEFPILTDNENRVVETETFERQIIEDKRQFEDYKKSFPLQFGIVEKFFKRELENGEKIIINNKGGWCTETDTIKIKQFI